MQGIIFNLLEGAAVDAHGARVWDELLDNTGPDGVYSSLGNDDDAQIMALVSAAGVAVSLPDAEVLRLKSGTAA